MVLPAELTEVILNKVYEEHTYQWSKHSSHWLMLCSRTRAAVARTCKGFYAHFAPGLNATADAELRLLLDASTAPAPLFGAATNKIQSRAPICSLSRRHLCGKRRVSECSDNHGNTPSTRL